ncbi:MAG: histidine kinase [Vallitalea sp.]|jgi:signal transduction histidine kinase|nr:histidine kinase [Vallitalea sp.]
MKEVLKIEISAICTVHIIAIILSIIFFMIFYMKAKKDYSLYAFLVMQVSMIGWMVFKIFKTVSPTEVSRWWFIVGYYFCACVFELAFLEFTYSNYKGKPIKKKIRYLLYCIVLFQFSWILTNPAHHLFYATYNFWRDSFGILFYVHTVLEYSFIIVGFVYGCKIFKDRFIGKSFLYKLLISSAIIIPLILNMLFITKVLHKFVRDIIGIPVIFDITPIVFVFSTMVFVYATFNHEFIDLSPIIRYEIVHKLDTPICVLDSGFEVIYFNEKTESIFGNDTKKILNNAFKNTHKNKKDMEIDNKIFNISLNEVNTLKETQYLVTLNNITDYKSIESRIVHEQKELENTKKNLESTINKLKETSKIGARNYIARELHDIIGHSLVVTIKLLDVAKLYFYKDKELSTQAIKDGFSSIESGIDAMENIKKKDKEYTGVKLKKDIEKILHRIKLSGISSHLSFKGLYYDLEEKTYDVINKICLELVTNSIKHSNAKEIFISINIKDEGINILFMDNGEGCDNLALGNGLTGIKERLVLVNGTAEFVTQSGEGFMSKISILP